jgi:hypothetical protein
MPQVNQVAGSTRYTSSSDFCRVFQEDMNGLYLLSFLLTADREKAEQCFVSGLQDSVEGSPVFKEWARSWARRAIIQNAVRVINPRSRADTPNSASVAAGGDTFPAVEHAGIAAVLALEPFERFVYVMTTLERYSDHECSLFLGCARREVAERRIRAVLQVGGSTVGHSMQTEPPTSQNSASQERSSSLIELLFGQRLATSS